jgi:phage-related protein
MAVTGIISIFGKISTGVRRIITGLSRSIRSARMMKV